jgi:hypothetical protein
LNALNSLICAAVVAAFSGPGPTGFRTVFLFMAVNQVRSIFNHTLQLKILPPAWQCA